MLGLSIRTIAGDHQGQMPTNLSAAISSLGEGQFAAWLADQMPPEATADDIGLDQFELAGVFALIVRVFRASDFVIWITAIAPGTAWA